jgi:ArsR family transcriptional regulator
MPSTGLPLADATSCCRALADATRLEILQLLVGREVCVCELAGPLGISQPLLSHHLKALREAGLVRARRDGRWMHYTLEPQGLEELAAELLALAGAHHDAKSVVACCPPKRTDT